MYANDPTFTDVDVTFTLTLGPLPNPAKVNVTEQKIAYEPAVVLHEVAETETINRAFEQETVKDFFKDLAEFKADLLTGAETIVKSQRTSVKPAVNCSAYTYFRVTDRVLASTPYIRLSQADLTSYNDTYAFETKVDTWYGVAYSFATTASLVKPVYSLIYHEDLVDMTQEIPTVKIAGTKASGTYEINTDDLSKYFGVEKCNASVANYLKIKYEYVTPLANAEWINKGYENIPAILPVPVLCDERFVAWSFHGADHPVGEIRQFQTEQGFVRIVLRQIFPSYGFLIFSTSTSLSILRHHRAFANGKETGGQSAAEPLFRELSFLHIMPKCDARVLV